ncbi:TlpA family protein disulfide reductase [Formosa sediminum]|uniref:TlpA family protein disulfide reductase n=1 Tax=Formosa sediminum TaxID=2594004 RepID=A0A516GLS4_9FLAO|nr:TlpA disulfide reductase family protein [Formosa sediminum]QDO92478.1 TlpA family protein disulfide reductase [Formosa sediminum]
MKTIFLSLVLFCNLLASAQNIQTPEYVIIANNQIITQAQLGEYAKNGDIKSMNKGVTEDYRNELAAKFGDKIGDREFIIQIDLFTEAEKKEHAQQQNTSTKLSEIDLNEGLKLNVNDTAADFTVNMVNNETITLSDLKGKVVLLNFWATWCAPCLLEFHEIPDKILKKFKDEDFVFLPISRGETQEKVLSKMTQLQEKGIEFNTGLDPNKNIWDQYATKYIPKNFVIDKNGIIRFISTGNTEGSVDLLAAEIENLLQQ